MKDINGLTEIYRNYKILYLIYKSGRLDRGNCEFVLQSLLPADGEDVTDKNREDMEAIMRDDDSYQCYSELIFKIVQDAQENCL